jgi:hypothetical protein
MCKKRSYFVRILKLSSILEIDGEQEFSITFKILRHLRLYPGVSYKNVTDFMVLSPCYEPGRSCACLYHHRTAFAQVADGVTASSCGG